MSDDRQFGPSGDRCQVERVLSVEHLESLADAWNALAQRDPQARIFQSHTWLCTWLRYHHCDRMEILVARRGDRLTAVLPLCAHTRGFGPLSLRVLRFAADNDSDYCDALSDPEYPQDLGALWTALRERADWHTLDLRYVPERGYTTRLLPAGDAGILVDRQRHDIAPYMDLSKDWRETLPKRQRDSILRRTRRLRERGAVSFEVATHPESVGEMLAQMAKIHVARWQARGQTSMFCFEEYRAWLQALCLRLLPTQQLYLCRLALDDDPVSIGLYFLDGRRILGYISTFAASYADYSPGHILEAMVIDDVRARGRGVQAAMGAGGNRSGPLLDRAQDGRRRARVLVDRPDPAAPVALPPPGNARPGGAPASGAAQALMKPRQGIRHRAGWRPPILMYHRVGEGERDPLLRRFTLSRERFEAQMRCLRRLRCHAVSPEQIARWLEGGAHLPPRPVAITFDDGYADTYHIAAPILEAYRFRATLFLVSDYIGRKATWDADVAADDGFPLMSWEEARDLARRGHWIGSHTRTHRELPLLDEAALAAELLGSRLDLQRQLGQRVHLLAYPYSQVDDRCRQAARAAGYRAACAGEGIDYHRWCLDRVNTAEASLPLFLAKLSPWFYLFRRARARRW